MTVVMVMVIDVIMTVVMVMVKLIVTMVITHRGESSQTNQILFLRKGFFCFVSGTAHVAHGRARLLARASECGLTFHIVRIRAIKICLNSL